MKKIALFDLDGTITYKDTMFEFIKFTVGKGPMIFGFAQETISFLYYFSGRISNGELKEKFLARIFRGWTKDDLNSAGENFGLKKLPQLIRPGALEKINWHKSNEHRVVIVSASAGIWLEAWCRSQDIELISTQFQFSNGRFTGRFKGENCYGPEKIRRIKEEINLESYDHIYAYGDSSGDTEMLALAHEAFYKPFREIEPKK